MGWNPLAAANSQTAPPMPPDPPATRNSSRLDNARLDFTLGQQLALRANLDPQFDDPRGLGQSRYGAGQPGRPPDIERPAKSQGKPHPHGIASRQLHPYQLRDLGDDQTPIDNDPIETLFAREGRILVQRIVIPAQCGERIHLGGGNLEIHGCRHALRKLIPREGPCLRCHSLRRISSANSPTFSRVPISDAENLRANSRSAAITRRICCRLSHSGNEAAVSSGLIVRSSSSKTSRKIDVSLR